MVTDLTSLQATVYGHVQGVYFRAFTASHAQELGLTGYVRNLLDGKTVEIQAEGERDKLERLINHLKAGPPAAKVEKVETNWAEYTGNYYDFSIRY